ncbi:MAG: glycosyltransferase family 8 protein [Bacteroidales bacterium]|jgi:lipopolysaccharide biosynthesis glycosyltransferase|nr:glycosyltransferase family 8 protein [Bacteroidales bacterium]MBQ2331328.1 glycosyltransferase family 8 protein [Bacteroidales bacterium]MBQ7609945.1 glycosyltransferase family 8 protein [Bacteroidales bacterium]
MKTIVPIFFSVNDAYSPFLATAIHSIRENASPDFRYHIHILTDDISEENRRKLSALGTDSFCIEFHPLSRLLRSLPAVEKLSQHCFGAFSSLTIYFRLFIPELFPQYDKGIYLDADLVVPGDISWLYREPLGRRLVGAVADYSIQKIAPFMQYIDEYVGVDHKNYVNSGVLLLNMKRLREVDLSGRFLSWVEKYGLETVAPDQDYLNALCWDGIQYLDPDWNAMPSECLSVMDNPQIIHFNLASKPWLNEQVPYDQVFWKYAAGTGYEAEIKARRRAFLQDSAAVKQYKGEVRRLIRMAARLTRSERSFRSLIESRQELRLSS